MKTLYPKSLKDLKNHVLTKSSSIYVMSKTSTVIPYDQLEKVLSEEYIVNLSQLPKRIELIDENLLIEGGVTWEEAIEYLKNTNRSIMTYPTEKSACILAGLATSATGEMAFGYGTFRDQVLSCQYMDRNGQVVDLDNKRNILSGEYQDFIDEYQGFKNPPFPRFERNCDLLIGTEGQLGVITQAIIQTVKKESYSTYFFKLPKWEEDYAPHFQLVSSVQDLRDSIRICEFLDSNSLAYLKEPLVKNSDVIVLEIKNETLEEVLEKLLPRLSLIKEEDVFEISNSKFQELRVEIPRTVNEMNALKKVVKKGTDAQVRIDSLKDLLDYYRDWAKQGVKYNLFGHIGDCHLHFNFMPDQESVESINEKLTEFYDYILSIKGSPFAEHGIGIIKKSFLEKFKNSSVQETFKELKLQHDPENIFFRSGFLSE